MGAALDSFVASLFVAMTCIPFSAYQGRMLVEVVLSGRPRPRGSRPLTEHPRITQTYVAQSLEIAYAFPALILTTIAYGQLFAWLQPVPTVLIMVAFASLTFVTWFSSPRRVQLFILWRWLDISVVTWAVIVANATGLIIAIAYKGS